MEVLLVLLSLCFFIAIVILISFRSSINSFSRRINYLIEQNEDLKQEIIKIRKEGISPVPPQKQEQPVVKPVYTPPPPPVTAPVYKEPEEIKSIAPETPKPAEIIAGYQYAAPVDPPPVPEERESWWEKFLRNNPDLEKFIGENLVNKVGIAILVLGISFFVKYAIDQDWINETGRVAIGLAAGMILSALGHYLRNSYRSFSSVLAGGGIAVYYFTIAFAFHQYHLVSQSIAFILMVLITGFAILLSVLYNRIEMGVIAAVGGFLTPFMLSTGEGNYIVLFTYLVILNTGLLALAFYKRWTALNILALFFTHLIFGGWLLANWWNDVKDFSRPLSLLFATIFYFLFLGMNLVHQVRFRLPFRKYDFLLLIYINAAFFASGIYLLDGYKNGVFMGLFTAGTGLVNLVLARYFFRNSNASRLMVYLLIGLTLTFLTLAIPVQLRGHAITMFWMAEFVLLFWLYQRSSIRLFAYSCFITIALALGSLFMDWVLVVMNTDSGLVIIYNDLQGLVNNIVAVAAFAALALLLKKEKQTTIAGLLPRKEMLQLSWLTAIVLSWLTSVYGVNLVFRAHAGYEAANVYHRLISQLFAFALLVFVQRRKLNRFAFTVLGAAMVYFIYHVFSFGLIEGLAAGVAGNHFSSSHLVLHWLSVIAACCLLYASLQMYSRSGQAVSGKITWTCSILFVIFISQEMKHIYLLISGPGMEGQYYKVVMTIIWAMASFGFMWYGMKRKNRSLRIVSLSLFTLALLKLFISDLRDISEGGKIAAFILLGILLLTISFMYQKLKKMIIDDVAE